MVTEESFIRLYEEIVTIRHLLELLARSDIKEELEKIATTDERKNVWALCTGFLSTREMSEMIGVSQRAIQIFVGELRDADLITIERRGYPKRKYDYVPSGWEARTE